MPILSTGALTGTERWGLVRGVSKREKDRQGSHVAAPPRLEPEPSGASAGHWKPSLRTVVFQRSLVAFIAGLLLVWIVPATLDWNRYRNAIAGFAAAELGRPVSIGGGVTLRLLPRAILTAADVTFPDQGDGVSARLHALRLEVSIWPLLRGRLVVRDLVLGEPVLRLPWPLPPNLGTPVSPYVRHPFTARLEHGGVELGGLELTGIDASLRSEATTGALQILGAAQVAGAPWRFTTSLAAPDADGQAALTVQVSGLDAFSGTKGSFDGRLAAGTLTGLADGGGPDLSRLLASPAGPWHASGPFRAAAGLLALPDLALAVPGAAGARASVILRITGHAGLDLRLDATDIDVMPWEKAVAGMQGPSLPMRLTLDADHARLLGGSLDHLAATVAWDGNAAVLEQARAVLPGRAVLTLSAGKLERDADGLSVAGPASLDAPDLHATLAWLHPLAPSLLGAPAGPALRSARIDGSLRRSGEAVSLSGMAGVLDGSGIAGGFGIGLAARPGFGAGVVLDQLNLDDVAAAAPGWPGFDGDLALRAKSTVWHGQALGTLDTVLHAANGSVSVNRLALEGAAGRLALSGRLDTDGRLTDAHVSAKAADLTRFSAAAARLGVPGALLRPGLWEGDGALEMTASGPANAWAVQLRADAGDLRLETQATVDADARRGTATITVRHPGAPRLLEALGATAPARWLETGSFALLAHLFITPRHVRVIDMDVTAALLRLSGHGNADFSGDVPTVEAWLDADTLPLPWREAVPDSWLTFWQGSLHVSAGHVLTDLVPAAEKLRAEVTVQGGALLAEPWTATVGTGTASGRAAADLSQRPARLAAEVSLAGIGLPAALTGLPVDVGGGALSGTLDLDATGQDAGAWLASANGSFALTLKDAVVLGMDLARVARLSALRQPAPRVPLVSALTSGTTGGLDGALSGEIAHGRLSLAQASLAAPAGSLGITGTLALDGSGTDLAITVVPAVPVPPPLRVRLSGPWASAKAEAEVPRPPPVPPRRRGARMQARPR